MVASAMSRASQSPSSDDGPGVGPPVITLWAASAVVPVADNENCIAGARATKGVRPAHSA